jgi:hypothetical protein
MQHEHYQGMCEKLQSTNKKGKNEATKEETQKKERKRERKMK